MHSSDIVKEMLEMKTMVSRHQGLVWTPEQKERYAELLELRRAFVKHWHEEGKVWVGPSQAGKLKEEE
jgi:hypothetical protein